MLTLSILTGFMPQDGDSGGDSGYDPDDDGDDEEVESLFVMGEGTTGFTDSRDEIYAPSQGGSVRTRVEIAEALISAMVET